MYAHNLSYAFSYMYIYFSLLSFIHSPSIFLSLSLFLFPPSLLPFIFTPLSLPQSEDTSQQRQSLCSKTKKILTYNTSLPLLIKAWESLKTSTVLHGDYDLKLQRQEYYLSKKEEVLKNSLNPFDWFRTSSCV